MDRRGFLRSLGLCAAAAVAPTKTYAFFGGILRPKPLWATLPITVSEIKQEWYTETFKWEFSLGEPIYRITDIKIETGPNGEVIAWAPTERSRFITRQNT